MNNGNNKNELRLTVAFAPDWREGNPYQSLLARALQQEQVDVVYSDPRRGKFSLFETARRPEINLIHLHWPEAFFNPTGAAWRRMLRKLRYLADLRRAAAAVPLVLTAHNLYPHDRWDCFGMRSLIRETYAKASVVIAHSPVAGESIRAEFKMPQEKICIIPHGNLADAYPPLPPREQARKSLNLDPRRRVVLMLGVIQEYKGIEEAILWWKQADPCCDLWIVGAPEAASYLEELKQLAGDHPGIRFAPVWQSDDEIAAWLSAADGVLFNYRKILTSGAAVLARAMGVPTLIPARLSVVDLDEPHASVTRFQSFESDFAVALTGMLGCESNFAAAEDYRNLTAWSRVARATADVYRSVLKN
jgi:glycosyltransferase involved in cell wall biosynthesis